MVETAGQHPLPVPVIPTRGGTFDRFLRLHSFELLIFVILFVLLALCLASVPLISESSQEKAARDIL
jgi:hypothetical protein